MPFRSTKGSRDAKSDWAVATFEKPSGHRSVVSLLSDGLQAVRGFTSSTLGTTAEPTHRHQFYGPPSIAKNKIVVTVYDSNGEVIVEVPKAELKEIFFWPVKEDNSKVDLWVWKKADSGSLSYKQEYAATFNKADVQGLFLDRDWKE